MPLNPADAFIFNPAGVHTENTSLSSAVTLTPPAGTGASKLLLQALAQNIRFTLDGTVPTATKGFRLYVGDMIIIPIGADTVIKVIQEAASADIEYQFGT